MVLKSLKCIHSVSIFRYYIIWKLQTDELTFWQPKGPRGQKAGNWSLVLNVIWCCFFYFQVFEYQKYAWIWFRILQKLCPKLRLCQTPQEAPKMIIETAKNWATYIYVFNVVSTVLCKSIFPTRRDLQRESSRTERARAHVKICKIFCKILDLPSNRKFLWVTETHLFG